VTLLQNLRSIALPCSLALISLSGSSVVAAAASEAGISNTWNVLIALLVLAATAGSAALNIAAIRQWNKNWGVVSAVSLVSLLLWCMLILVAKQLDPGSHELWQLEIFAWAMLNMIYMVTVMTAKRMFAKQDIEESTSS
jgi:hypothetical protein